MHKVTGAMVTTAQLLTVLPGRLLPRLLLVAEGQLVPAGMQVQLWLVPNLVLPLASSPASCSL